MSGAKSFAFAMAVLRADKNSLSPLPAGSGMFRVKPTPASLPVSFVVPVPGNTPSW